MLRLRIMGFVLGLGLSGYAHAQTMSPAEIKLKGCMVRAAVEVATIPASTVGYRSPTQIDGLFGLVKLYVEKKCADEMNELKSSRSISETEMNGKVCEAVKVSIGLYMTASQTEALMMGSKNCLSL